jgi:four helix bundle protein
MKDFRTLQVWHKAHHLILAAYRITANFPKEERYGLISQIRRCSASIAANIAEGCGRRGNAELHRFLQISAVQQVSLNTIGCSRGTFSS